MIDSSPYVTERLRPIIETLHERVSDELSESDWLALTTAVMQAALGGFREGVAHVAAECNLLVSGTIIDDSQDPDWWAERYGHDD